MVSSWKILIEVPHLLELHLDVYFLNFVNGFGNLVVYFVNFLNGF